MTELADLMVASLGEPRFDSPLAACVADRRSNEHHVGEDDRVIFHDTVSRLNGLAKNPDQLPSFEPGGPRRKLYFPGRVDHRWDRHLRGAVSGLNDVIRGLVMELAKQYGVAEAIGYRHGFAGMVEGRGYAPMRLTPSSVHDINQHGGTVLGSSRGAQDPDRIIDRLVADGVDILFVIGGDGSMPGAGGLAARLREGSLPIGVIGIPKTIDNDIPFIGQSFGFVTSFSVAAKSINAAMIEAHSAIGGVDVVKLMGRHSGFIACYAALANHEADLVLIPEVPFGLDGPNGFLAALHQRVKDTGNAVVVVAEGAGQDVLERTGSADPSGNAALGDIGTRLRAAITQHFEAQGTALRLK